MLKEKDPEILGAFALGSLFWSVEAPTFFSISIFFSQRNYKVSDRRDFMLLLATTLAPITEKFVLEE